MHRVAWSLAAVLAVVGSTMVVVEFDVIGSPWRLLGLTLVLIGTLSAHAGLTLRRNRTLDEEFEAGYRAGHRAGRRTTPTAAQVVVSIEGRKRGWIPPPSVRALAGHRADARRAQAHPDRPAERDRQNMG